MNFGKILGGLGGLGGLGISGAFGGGGINPISLLGGGAGMALGGNDDLLGMLGGMGGLGLFSQLMGGGGENTKPGLQGPGSDTGMARPMKQGFGSDIGLARPQKTAPYDNFLTDGDEGMQRIMRILNGGTFGGGGWRSSIY